MRRLTGPEFDRYAEMLRSVDDIVYKHFVPDNKNKCDCNSRVVPEYFKADICSLYMKGFDIEEIKKFTEDTIRERFYKQLADELIEFIEDHVSFDNAKRQADIRTDFAAAFRNVKKGTELSGILDYGFSKEDISELAKLHKSNKFRKKIEDLLEDCNFHYESGKFASKQYDEFIIAD